MMHWGIKNSLTVPSLSAMDIILVLSSLACGIQKGLIDTRTKGPQMTERMLLQTYDASIQLAKCKQRRKPVPFLRGLLFGDKSHAGPK